MSYSELAYSASMGFIYPMGAFFLIILLAGDNKYKWQAGVLVTYAIISLLIPDLDQSSLSYKQNWINQCFISLLINGAAMVAMLFTSFFGKLHKRQSLILLFAVIYHAMVLYRFETKYIPLFVKEFLNVVCYFYSTSVILTYLMLMSVSYNGILTAYSNSLGKLQRIIHGSDVYYDSFCDGVFKRKNQKEG